MAISKQSDISVWNIICKEERIKHVGTFKYLGFIITSDARCDTEIEKRIAFSADTFKKMEFFFTNRNIRMYTKINTMKAYITARMWMLDTDKRPKKKTWNSRNVVHQKNNENIMEWKEAARRSNDIAGYKYPYSKLSGKYNYIFFGHINKANGPEKQILSGKIRDTKIRGRQRTKYTESLNNFVTRKESPNIALIRRTDDREVWKAMIADRAAADLTHDDDDSKR